MEIVVSMCVAVIMVWLGVMLIILEVKRRRKEKEFSKKLRKLSNTTYSTSNSGAIVKYDVNLDDYPSNIIEIGRGSC